VRGLAVLTSPPASFVPVSLETTVAEGRLAPQFVVSVAHADGGSTVKLTSRNFVRRRPVSTVRMQVLQIWILEEEMLSTSEIAVRISLVVGTPAEGTLIRSVYFLVPASVGTAVGDTVGGRVDALVGARLGTPVPS